jgi:hypothetical protein
MRGRRKVLVALAGLAVVVAVGAFVFWPRPLRIAHENFERIKVGMTRAEVEVILGPPGDYKTGPNKQRYVYVTLPGRGTSCSGILSVEGEYSIHMAGLGMRFPGEYRIAEWYCDTCAIVVGFDRQGSVAFSHFAQLELRQSGLIENLVWRTKRLWRGWFA